MKCSWVLLGVSTENGPVGRRESSDPVTAAVFGRFGGVCDRLFSSQVSPLLREGTLLPGEGTCPVGNRPLLTKFTVSILLLSTAGSLYWLDCCGVRWGGGEVSGGSGGYLHFSFGTVRRETGLCASGGWPCPGLAGQG